MLQDLSMKMETKQGYILISFKGNLEYGKIEELKKELQTHLQSADTDYIIDMQHVQNIDSTGFGMIVNFAKKVSVKGEKIAIIVVDDFIRNLFSISQCDKVFPIVKNESDAKVIIKGNWTGELSINDY